MNWPGDFLNKVIEGDCLEVMKQMPDKCVDLVVTDPPYGTTSNEWDIKIDLEVFWHEIKRIMKVDTAIVMTASQPFTTELIHSNIKNFKYSWVWNKKLAGNAILAKLQPLKIHEDVVVFANGKPPYYPIMKKGVFRIKGGIKDRHGTFNGAESPTTENDDYYPVSVIEISGAALRSERQHPTEKPIELMEYLISTYSEPGGIVFDPFNGSGTTTTAAKQTGRRFIGIEKESRYIKIAEDRLRQEVLL